MEYLWRGWHACIWGITMGMFWLILSSLFFSSLPKESWEIYNFFYQDLQKFKMFWVVFKFILLIFKKILRSKFQRKKFTLITDFTISNLQPPKVPAQHPPFRLLLHTFMSQFFRRWCRDVLQPASASRKNLFWRMPFLHFIVIEFAMNDRICAHTALCQYMQIHNFILSLSAFALFLSHL